MTTPLERLLYRSPVAQLRKALSDGKGEIDAKAVAVLEAYERAERQIANAREEVSRSVRSKESRFRL